MVDRSPVPVGSVKVWAALATAVMLCLALVQAVAPAPPAAAAGTCGTQNNYFDGFFQPGRPDQFEGASSYIVVRDGTNCTGDTSIGNFTNAWVMIASNITSAQYNGWGQSGFERTAGYPLRWFSQFYDGYGSLETRYSTFSVSSQLGVRHAFRVLWYESCRCLRATIDRTTWAESSFNPFAYPAESNWGPQPWSPQFLAETGYRESDVPGGPTTRTRYSGLGGQRVSDDRLILMPCILAGVDDNPAQWGRKAYNCNTFDVWTR